MMALPVSRSLLCSAASCLKRVHCAYVRTNIGIRSISTASRSFHSKPIFSQKSSHSMKNLLHQSNYNAIFGSAYYRDTCRTIHSESNKSKTEALVEFLNDEIKLEDGHAQKLPNVKDFNISTNQSEVTLTKTSGIEKIKIKFNVNHTVNSADAADNETEESQMVSKPPFTIDISKGGQVLSISCAFTEDVADPQTGEQYADTLEIEEVSLHSGEWNEETYTLSSSVMDGNLYDHLLDLLKDHGIDEEFVDQLIDFSTVYEQGQYLNFLKGLQSYVKK